MTKKEWMKELDELAAACRSFQSAVALDDDETPGRIDWIWALTEDIVREHEEYVISAEPPTPIIP